MGWIRKTSSADSEIVAIPTSATPDTALARFAGADRGSAVAQLWRRGPEQRRAEWRAELDSDLLRLRKSMEQGAPAPTTVIDLTALEERLLVDLVAIEESTSGLGLCTHDRVGQATSRCGRCRDAFCDDCVVRPFGVTRDPFCVPCALVVSGVRRKSRDVRLKRY